MTEKEYYNEIVLQKYYHKIFDEKIQKEIIKPLHQGIINTFTEFTGGLTMQNYLEDDNGKKLKIRIEIKKIGEW